MTQAPRKHESASKPVRRSVLLHWLHTLSALLYAYIGQSLFGRLRTAYGRWQAVYERSVVGSILHSRRKRHERILFRVRVAMAAMIEQSLLYRALARLRRALLRCSVSSYGIFSFFFGCFTVVAYLLGRYFDQTPPFSELVTGLCMILISPLMLFGTARPIGRALVESLVLRWLLVDVCGIPAEKLHGTQAYSESRDEGEDHAFVALVLAVTLGTLCGLTEIAPVWVPLVILLLLVVQLIFLYPESGLLLVAFSTPLITLIDGVRPTALLLCAIGVTMLSFLLKLIGGKRVFHPELLDGSVLLLGALYLFGGLVTRGGAQSLYSALTYLALLMCYFLAVSLLRTQAWLDRINGAMCLSCVIVACLGVGQYFMQDLGVQYLDVTLFSDLGGRVYATLENPNMLAEYLILLFPLLMAMLFVQRRALGVVKMLLSCGVVVLCLVLTWSRGAWLGAAICTLLFLLLMGYRTLSYLVLSALPAAALLHTLPEQVTRRFMSIGSLSDSSIRYRVYLWQGVRAMLEDYWLCGIGVGEAAFCEIYSRYALPGIASAMHSHSVYLQLLCEMGVVGLVVLGITVVLFACSALSYITGNGERSGRLRVLGGFCGVMALLLMGVTDHVFYNYRIFLTFWLLMGVSVAQIRVGNAELRRGEPPHMVLPAEYARKRRS